MFDIDDDKNKLYLLIVEERLGFGLIYIEKKLKIINYCYMKLFL